MVAGMPGARTTTPFVAALALLACSPREAREVDGWALARAALVDGESCYADRPDFCISDPAFVDAAIQGALDARHGGTMPKLDRDVEAVIRSARVHYEDASREPEQLLAIAKLVEARYAAPVIDADSDPELVNVDLGALPGELTLSGRTSTIVLKESALTEDFWWSSAEAGRVLARYAEAHPDKAVVRVEVLIPKAASKHLVYRYFREKNRVAFGEIGEHHVYLGPETSLIDMVAGKLDLSNEARRLCSRPKDELENGGWCPWKDPYAEAQAEAKRKAEREARSR